MIFLYIIFAYIFIVFVGLRLIVPHLGFRPKKIPEKLPDDLQREIERFNAIATDDEHFVFLAHKYITSRYIGSRLKTVTEFWKAFQNPLYQTHGFMHCMNQNFLLRAMLVRSGRFREEHVEVKTTFLNIFIHQYLNVRIGDCDFPVDPWSHFLGVRPGEKNRLFR